MLVQFMSVRNRLGKDEWKVGRVSGVAYKEDAEIAPIWLTIFKAMFITPLGHFGDLDRILGERRGTPLGGPDPEARTLTNPPLLW